VSGRRIFVKVCGLTEPDQAAAVTDAGADAIGLVFWARSPRAVTVERARDIGRALPPFVTRVGVFVDASRDEIARTADIAGLDVVQLHGSEPPEALVNLPRRALKALRVGPGFDAEEALRYAGVGAGLLLDTQVAGVGAATSADTEVVTVPGGTGQVFDWGLARGLSARVPFLVLAGGLHAGNVAEALREVRPSGVDVSSGVERAPGQKDLELVRRFVAAVRGAELLADPSPRPA
jgi:phosphoribosylanthranilate isomerase